MPRLLAVAVGLLLLQTPAWAQPRYNLENPTQEAAKGYQTKSGIGWVTIDARSPALEVRGWLRTGGTVSGSANEWWEAGDDDHQYVLRGVETRRERCFEYHFSLTSGRTAVGLLRLTPQQARSITGCDQDGWQAYPTTGVRETDDHR